MKKYQKQLYAALRKTDWFLVGFFAGIALLAWLLMTWITPYRGVARTEFAATPDTAAFVRAEIMSTEGSEGQARILEGKSQGQVVAIKSYSTSLRDGSIVLIPEHASNESPNSVTAPWRLPAVIFLLACMVLLAVLIGGRQGVFSIAGLGVSIMIIAWYILPRVIAGENALLVSIIGAFLIATIAVVIAHRFRWRTVISLLSIYIALAVVVLLAIFSGWFANLTGVYDETSNILINGSVPGVDIYGILLGGIIIASLGVLDDVVTTQVATVDELHQAKPNITSRELFTRGMSVGREHLSALVNTLALAYVGVALPMILVMSYGISNSSQLLLSLNYEYISVEAVRIAISSMGIILAIPLSTALAVVLIGKKQQVIAILKRLQPNSRR